MTQEVGIREFRSNLRRYMQRAKRGEEVVITERGRPVARLVGVHGVPTLDRLVAEGLVTLPKRPKGRVGRPRVTPGGSVTEILLRQRRERAP